MEKNVDIIARLGQIVQENTTAYRSDFDYDVETLENCGQGIHGGGPQLLLGEPPQRYMVLKGTGGFSSGNSLSFHLDLL